MAADSADFVPPEKHESDLSKKVDKGEIVLNPLNYEGITDAGSTGNSAPDQSAALTAFMSAADGPVKKAITKGQRVRVDFGQATIKGDITITTSDTIVSGEGRLYGQVKIGDGSALITRVGLKNMRLSPGASRDAVVINGAQFLDFDGLNISDCDHAFRFVASTLSTGQLYRRIKWLGCRVEASDYAIRAYRASSSPWGWCADWKIIGSNFSARRGGIYTDGIDGLTIDTSTEIFMKSPDSTVSGKGVYVGNRSNELRIDCKIFEPGEEGIMLINPYGIHITASITRAGERVPSDAIKIVSEGTIGASDAYVRGFILPAMELHTGAAIGIYNNSTTTVDYSGLTILPGTTYTPTTPGDYYYGSATIASPRPRYYVAPNVVQPRILDPAYSSGAGTYDSVLGKDHYMRIPKGPRAVEKSLVVSRTWAATEAKDVAAIAAFDTTSKSLWSKVLVEVQNLDSTDRFMAVYELLVSYHPNSNQTAANYVKLLHSGGLDTYTGTNAAVPRFTFSASITLSPDTANGNALTLAPAIGTLKATTVGSAAGNFRMSILSEGNLAIMTP